MNVKKIFFRAIYAKKIILLKVLYINIKKNELAEIDFLKQELLKKDEQLKKKMKCMIDI